MAINQPDSISNTAQAGFSTSWDWKNDYVSSLSEDGYERFSQFSATPSSTVIYAGPARFTGLSGDASILVPIGLMDGLSISSSAGVSPLWEIGSDRAFFTRGKTQHSLSVGKMLADQQSILYAMSQVAYRPLQNVSGLSEPGAESPNPQIMMNLDSEYFNVPLGILVVFKTRGGGDGYGKVLTGLYLESCVFQNYQFQVASQAPVIVENVSVLFDRPVPVSFA